MSVRTSCNSNVVTAVPWFCLVKWQGPQGAECTQVLPPLYLLGVWGKSFNFPVSVISSGAWVLHPRRSPPEMIRSRDREGHVGSHSTTHSRKHHHRSRPCSAVRCLA